MRSSKWKANILREEWNVNMNFLRLLMQHYTRSLWKKTTAFKSEFDTILDVRTMLMATAATCLIVAAALFIFQPRRFQLDGTLQLIVGWTFQGVSYLIFGLRGVTWDFLSIVVANTLLPVGYSFLFAAVQQFQDRSYSRAILFSTCCHVHFFLVLFCIFKQPALPDHLYIDPRRCSDQRYCSGITS